MNFLSKYFSSILEERSAYLCVLSSENKITKLLSYKETKERKQKKQNKRKKNKEYMSNKCWQNHITELCQ